MTIPSQTHEFEFPRPGERFAERYRIESLIGRGGYSRVYRSRQLDFDREVALKVLYPWSDEYAESRRVIEQRFYREVRFVAQLRGPHTVRVYDYGRAESGVLFMASELVPGTDLADVISKFAPLSESRSRRIFAQILQGLLEVHSLGVLHRDIKPANVMVYEHLGVPDQVKLLDFGIAKVFDADGVGLTESGMVVGTPGYMSPEQALGKELDYRADIFSVGLVAYEMLVGRPPYAGTSLQELANALKMGVRLPETLEVDPAFAAVIHRCVEIDPAARFQSVADVLEAMGLGPPTLESLPPAERPDGSILTFPMRFDPSGTTTVDTLVDADTGATSTVRLPRVESRDAVTAPNRIESGKAEQFAAAEVLGRKPDATETANREGLPSKPPQNLFAVGIIALVVLTVLAIFGIVSVIGGLSPGPGAQAGEAVTRASDFVSKAARNAELDAMIRAKEGAAAP